MNRSLNIFKEAEQAPPDAPEQTPDYFETSTHPNTPPIDWISEQCAIQTKPLGRKRINTKCTSLHHHSLSQICKSSNTSYWKLFTSRLIFCL
ncbi:hypothetical protein BDR04DRAFT_1090081 [Suillus decipiens]|nr:hypothetical protein BDR04DRAFT_1090081 [Suillus decipiens]